MSKKTVICRISLAVAGMLDAHYRIEDANMFKKGMISQQTLRFNNRWSKK